MATLILGGVGLWLWAKTGPPDERAIRGQLDALAAEFNAATTDGLGTVARVARLAEFFTPDVVVELGKGSPPIVGRETLMGMAARLQPRTSAFTVETVDVIIDALEPERAEVTFTLVIRRRSVVSGEESIDGREFAAEMRKMDGSWRIGHVTAIDTLR